MSEESVFLAAVEKRTPAERQAFLDEACGADVALRARVQMLLEADARARGILDRPAVGGPERTGSHPSNEQSGADVAREQPGAVVAGRYKLLEAIGEGGMGTVWVAEQTQPVKRKVALKLIKAGMDSKSVLARFEAERQALAVMDHPNIAKVLDGGLTDTGRPFFVMEYVKGVPITEYCDATRMSVSERLNLFMQVCSAVQHAHQKGIIHRDLKPSNILVAPYDDKAVPKVIDFGLAKAMHQSLTERTLHTAHETVLGTPLYMSPEQAQLNNLDVDTRSDIYSLGVLLYELLTGTTPLEKQRFKEAAWDEIKRIIREEEPPRPSTRLSSSNTLASLAAGRQIEPARLTKLVRGELDWIVMKSLEKDRARRYETANGFAMDIQRYLAGEPVLAAPPSARYRLRKFARKHRAGLTTAAVIGLLLVAGVAVSSWQAVRATRAEWLAQQRLEQVTVEKLRADEEAAIAQAVNEFLSTDLLRQADSGKQADRQFTPNPAVTVRELLDRAAAEVEKRFAGRPRVEAAVRQAIGEAYYGLGVYDRAVTHLTRVRDLRSANLGPDHASTLATLDKLADILVSADRSAEAIRMYEQVRDRRIATLGPDHPDTLTTLHGLADAQWYVGHQTDAIALYEQVWDRQTATLGPDHRETLATMDCLGDAYRWIGRRADAIRLLEQVRDRRTTILGPDHPTTLTTMNNLALAYDSPARRAEAIQLLEQVHDRLTTTLGPGHPATLMVLNNLALAYDRAGRAAEAIPLLERGRDRLTATLGPDHRDTLITLGNLARAYNSAGRAAEAISLYEWVWEKASATRGPDHPFTLDMLENLADALRGAKQFERAVERFREVLAARTRTQPADSPVRIRALSQLGQCLLQADRPADAEPVLREALTVREKNLPNQWPTFHSRSLLGGSLLGQKKYADAEPLLLTGYEGMKQRQKTIPAQGKIRIREAIDRLVQLYEFMDKKDEVKKWQAERANYSAIAPSQKK